ncbi:rod shape-determining protein MreC [SAR92 clade bacterium H455]|uniref:Cell shape-determining protein MreC n=1 Tax=SAR92 clade bacterium H455 TaxID=2974818 RepID=A0ABY5TNZ9_9GAMM|nr:rod shape-determining protein MreC [SAR92 clade bacterium H455]
MTNVFNKSSSLLRKFLVVSLLAVLLMIIDSFTPWLKPAYSAADNFVRPLYWIANIPLRVQEWSANSVTPRSEIESDNLRLTKESLIYHGQLQRMSDLAAENMRLRRLLNATELVQDSVLVTEVIGVSANPLRHTLTIDRGTADGVFVGQPLLDAEGLMGQIIGVHKRHSTALLITDSSHALPVQVLRNGLRSIAEGSADYNRLNLKFVSPTADIREGDKLVSSGLGGLYPAGYPVGTVLSIVTKPGDNFLEIDIDPSAEIDRSRHLLLLYTSRDNTADAVE